MGGEVRAFPALSCPARAPVRAGLSGPSPLPNLPSTRGRDWTVVTVVTMVPSGMMVRSSSIFLVGVMLGRGVEGVGVPRFPGEPSSYCSCPQRGISDCLPLSLPTAPAPPARGQRLTSTATVAAGPRAFPGPGVSGHTCLRDSGREGEPTGSVAWPRSSAGERVAL